MIKLSLYFKNKTLWFWLAMLVTVLIDGLNTMFYDKTQGFFLKILYSNDLISMSWLIGIYLLFIITVILSAMMSSYGDRNYLTGKQKKVKKFAEAYSLLLVLGFGIILMLPALHILGLTSTNESTFSDNSQYTWIMVICALFFVLLAFAFINQKTRFVLGTSKFLWAYIPVLILMSLFTSFSAALWEFNLYDPSKVVDSSRSTLFIEFIAVFPLYVLFFSAPRFILLRKSYHLIPLLSALITTGYFVWRSLEFFSL